MTTSITDLKKTFRSAIRRGTGEAYLLMQNNPGIDFSDEIIKASLKNFAYDGQCEGSRGSYLFGLIQLSVKQDKIRTAILNGLAVEQDDTWTLIQLFDLAKLFALKGDKEAKKAIYSGFANNPIIRSDWAGTSEILELDGLEGLKFIAEKFGKALEIDPDDSHDGYLIKCLQESNPEINVMLELEMASIDNHFIKVYLENVKQTEENKKNKKRETVIYNDVVEEVIQNKKRFFFRKFNTDELVLIANRFLSEKKLQSRIKLLSVFRRNKFPLDRGIILKLAKQSMRSKITGIAIDALQFLKSDDIRQFAVDKMISEKEPGKFVRILTSNYKEGDGAMLVAIVEKTTKGAALESLIIAYTVIYEENPTSECRLPLESLYEKHNCGMCRTNVVNLLIENNVLSEKIKSEIPFDCNEQTRALLTH